MDKERFKNPFNLLQNVDILGNSLKDDDCVLYGSDGQCLVPQLTDLRVQVLNQDKKLEPKITK